MSCGARPGGDELTARALRIRDEGPQADASLGDVQGRLVVAHRASLGIGDRGELTQHLAPREILATVLAVAAAAAVALGAALALVRRPQHPLLGQPVAAQQERLQRLLPWLQVQADGFHIEGGAMPVRAFTQLPIAHLDQAQGAGIGVLQQRDRRPVRQLAAIPALGPDAELVHHLTLVVEQAQPALAEFERRLRRRRAGGEPRHRQRRGECSGRECANRLCHHRHPAPPPQNIASFRLSL
ncbi:hypothetical protein ACFJIX_06130 [Roseateles sp. UC29_93]|uniref:hypothetical protein n=1 Tax=Roseateles sp. UC29_93 TaxID=3350177 RepID=UPI00366CB6A9